MKFQKLALLAVAAIAALNGRAQERLAPIPADKMTEAQKKTVAEYKEIRKTDLGAGPFGVLLRVPDYVVPALQMRLHNLNNSALSRKNTELAMGLIDEMTVAENQAKLANLIAYSPTNPKAFPAIDADISPWLATNPENVDRGFLISAEYWRDNLQKLQERWNTWKLS